MSNLPAVTGRQRHSRPPTATLAPPAPARPPEGTPLPPPDRPAPRKPGRPAKLTPATARAVTRALTAGSTVTAAARAAGVHRSTVFRWAAKGRNQDGETQASAVAAALARARAERSRNSVTREPLTDRLGRRAGVKVTRRLRNGVTEVTEEFTRPTRRELRELARRATAACEPGTLEALLGLGGIA